MHTPEQCADLWLTSVGVLLQTECKTQPEVDTPHLQSRYLCYRETFFVFVNLCSLWKDLFFVGTHHRNETGTLIEEVGECIGKKLTVSNCQGQIDCSVEHIKT